MVFSLLLPGELPKLKQLYIWQCKELKYIFGEYRVVGQVSQQEMILPLLTEVTLRDVPSFISIFQICQKCVIRPPQVLKEDSKEKHENSKVSAFSWAYGCCFLAPTKDTNIEAPNAKMEHHTISQGSCGSSKRMETVHIAKCLMRHPLSVQNIREMTLWGCSKLKSLFSISIATTMIMLEMLYIWECQELKDIITNEAEDDDHLNYTSIFPKLQNLNVCYCNKLKFIFPSTLSGGLQKLKYIFINEAHELKYVFGKYNEEECISNENENNELDIHLPALESLFIMGVPNMISIGVKKYQQKCSSVHIVETPKEIKQHMQDVTSETAKESELQEIMNVETLLTPTVGFQYFLNFHNLKQITIWRNKKLKTLFSVSACRNLPQLSKLAIDECEELVNVVEDDSHNHHHMNSSSIFPKLEDLSIEDCNKLEFTFPLSRFGSLQKFKSLIIKEAAELNCIFGNESDELRIHLPATLERLSLVGVPKIMNKILAKKYHVSFLSLQSIEFGDLQEFNERSFLDWLSSLQEMQLNKKVPKDMMKIIKDVQKLTKLGIRDSKIEEVLNLEGVEIEGTGLTLSLEEMQLKDLSELNHICKGPKCILSLPNLSDLNIIACKKLRVIFSVSMVKSLPQLSYLNIEDCNELMDIIEESVEGHFHQICFPKLEEISINRCNSLKCLFSISTSGMFLKLWKLQIEEAFELEQVFIHKQHDMQKMIMMDEVFPNLSNVTLRNLPRLVTICEGIDFQNVICSVNDCPKYQGINHIQEGPKDGDSENQAATNASPDFENSMTGINHIQEGPKDGDSENQAATNASPDFAKSLKEAMTTNVEEVASSFSKKETIKEIEAKNPTPALSEKALEGSTTKPQLRSSSLHGLEDDHKTSESIMQLQEEGLAETKTTKASHKTNIPFHYNSIDAILKERAEESSTSEDVVVSTMVVDSTPRNSWTSSVVSEVEGSKSGPSSLSLEKTEKEAVKIQTLQLSIDPTWTNSESIKDTKEHGHEENHAEECSYSRKQSTGPINNLPRKDSAPNAKETTKGIDENATTTYKSPMSIPFMRALAIKEIGDHSSIQEEAESDKPIKATLPQVIPSLHYLAQIVDAGTSFSKLEICEIFKLVELKHGETDLLSQALEQYPQLLLPREHRTYRIIAWSYRVLVDILVILATKTPNTITPFEKSTLEANLNEAIVLGFDKDWVEFIRAKVFGVDMSDVSKAKEEIKVMEVKLREIDSKLLGLSEDRKKVIVNMNMFKDIISAKDKPFGI
ncbi:hypothetical protein QN277_018914 [Acacia crassicarpa]|uniref:Disease resistance protein At4g27190-like leucine-rich repeats domain-containing protein n=1 Tax=Acacia crassicarpa TaxID=499986 RepID=A0AAE1MS14_9FABA|nr:hypothetical protein QN277_018914 [Acacia crassicarpa]